MDLKPRHARGFLSFRCTSAGTEPAASGSPFEPARRSARLTGTEELMQDLLVRHDHRERHRYRSRLRASQRGRDHRVPIGLVRDRLVHRLAAPAPPRTAWRRVTSSAGAQNMRPWLKAIAARVSIFFDCGSMISSSRTLVFGGLVGGINGSS